MNNHSVLRGDNSQIKKVPLEAFLAEPIERINLSFDANVITTAQIIEVETRASQDVGSDCVPEWREPVHLPDE
jgi:hypothetical protein